MATVELYYNVGQFAFTADTGIMAVHGLGEINFYP